MSGALAMRLGLGRPIVDISGGGGANDTQLDPSPAVASISFENDGDIISTTVPGPADAGDWIAPKAAAPDLYEIKAELVGSALDGGSDATGSWLALSTTRTWVITQSGVGSKSASLSISIRYGATVISTGTFALDAAVV